MRTCEKCHKAGAVGVFRSEVNRIVWEHRKCTVEQLPHDETLRQLRLFITLREMEVDFYASRTLGKP